MELLHIQVSLAKIVPYKIIWHISFKVVRYFIVHVEPNMPLERSPEHREGGEPATTEAGCGVSVEVRGQGVRGRNLG